MREKLVRENLNLTEKHPEKCVRVRVPVGALGNFEVGYPLSLEALFIYEISDPTT